MIKSIRTNKVRTPFSQGSKELWDLILIPSIITQAPDSQKLSKKIRILIQLQPPPREKDRCCTLKEGNIWVWRQKKGWEWLAEADLDPLVSQISSLFGLEKKGERERAKLRCLPPNSFPFTFVVAFTGALNPEEWLKTRVRRDAWNVIRERRRINMSLPEEG